VAAIRRRASAPDVLRWRIAMLAAIGLAGVILSLGTNTPVYGWLFAVFPPIRSLRVAARFGNLFLLAVAVLGGVGVSMVRRRSLRGDVPAGSGGRGDRGDARRRGDAHRRAPVALQRRREIAGRRARGARRPGARRHQPRGAAAVPAEALKAGVTVTHAHRPH